MWRRSCAAAELPNGRTRLEHFERTEVIVLLDPASDRLQITGNLTEPEFAPARIGELPRSAIPSEQAKRDLGWQPTVSWPRS